MLRTVLVALLGGIAASIGTTLGDLAREAIEPLARTSTPAAGSPTEPKVTQTPATFPVHSQDARVTPQPHCVPWLWLARFEEQAKRNHDGQDLAELARRGGLTWLELLAIGLGVRALRISLGPAAAQDRVLQLVDGWRATLRAP